MSNHDAVYYQSTCCEHSTWLTDSQTISDNSQQDYRLPTVNKSGTTNQSTSIFYISYTFFAHGAENECITGKCCLSVERMYHLWNN